MRLPSSTRRPRTVLLAAAAVAVAGLVTITASADARPAPAPSPAASTASAASAASVASAPVARAAVARAAVRPAREVWQKAQAAYPENRSNPLAGRLWGVYEGPQDQVYAPYQAARGQQKALLGKIALRPRMKWFGSFVPDSSIRSTVQDYIASSQDGDPTKLVQFAVFRMEPWEHEACSRPSRPAEKASYQRWITNLAAGIGSTPTMIVMQPDGPFLWCVPDRPAKARLLTWATRKLSSLPHTSVYIDAGAADWCENNKTAVAQRCAEILKLTGIRYARGFALDSTHYDGAAADIEHGTRIVKILQRSGYGTKHFVVDTAQNGRPTAWLDMIPATPHDLTDNARVCQTKAETRCVTLGIPPTTQVAAPKWGLPAGTRSEARRYVDAFVWDGRPWLFNQAQPFMMGRAITMAKSTPWPGPITD